MHNFNDLTITADSLPRILRNIAQDGCSVLRIDRGNGCAGPAMIAPEDVEKIEIDEAVYLHDAPADVVTEFRIEVELFGLGALEDHTHVGIKRDGNGWTGYYLLWIP